MTPKDLKACADLIRKTCDTIDRMNPSKAVKGKLLDLRRYAEELWPEASPSFAKIQWEELKKRIGWRGTEEEYDNAMRASLDILKARYPNPKKSEIAI